ncbi:Variant surface glycoprotein [Trypanosoma congolense IL3000]|uniref:Variant surface glycoprotein n=1 Tax=Trypanosoma congolense (strain IL3000) TaxID=1068625 RepID=F9W722_TRYCI|nr:Variant surface glycoprotein [Trypanosoma congolense IL3000]
MMVCWWFVCDKCYSLFLFCLGMKIKEAWIARKGVLSIVVFMAMVMEDVRVYSYPDGTVFNDREYKALCDVFQASLDLWNASRESAFKLGSGLEGILRQALFGTYGTRNMDSITNALPRDYKNPRLWNRGTRCGGCHKDDKFYYPGSSITHDFMCLCTPGQGAEPFYGFYFLFYKENGFKLCGRGREEMVPDRYHGWYTEARGSKVSKVLERSWESVVWGCFNGWKIKPEQGSLDLKGKVTKLNATMKNFTMILKQVNNLDKLGGFEEHTEADGSDERHIHVRYAHCNSKKRPWWKKLKETLDGKKPEDLLVSRPVNLPAGRPGEAPEDGLGEELSEEMEENEGDVESGGPTSTEATAAQDGNGTHTQGLSSSTNNTIGTLTGTATGNSTHPRFGYLRSGSHIKQPLLFLSAAFSI